MLVWSGPRLYKKYHKSARVLRLALWWRIICYRWICYHSVSGSQHVDQWQSIVDDDHELDRILQSMNLHRWIRAYRLARWSNTTTYRRSSTGVGMAPTFGYSMKRLNRTAFGSWPLSEVFSVSPSPPPLNDCCYWATKTAAQAKPIHYEYDY